MPAPSSSLDTSKQTDGPLAGLHLAGDHTPPTEFRSQPATAEETSFRHSSWRLIRQKVWDSMTRCHRSSARMERFRNCGAAVYVQLCESTGDVRLSCDRCRDRLCLACGRDRAGQISEALIQFTDEKKLRFVTLTRRHSHASLADQLDSLYRCFSVLRRREWWKRHVTGGGAFLEVKLNEKTHTWHVHLHLLVEGSFMPQRELSQEWLAVTSDSSIVDVRQVPAAGDVCRYVTKYVTKPLDASIYNTPEKLDEFVVAIQGRRLCLTFGDWRGHNLSDPPEDHRQWSGVCSFWDLRRRAGDGDARALFAIRVLLDRRPELRNVLNAAEGPEPPPPPDDCPF